MLHAASKDEGRPWAMLYVGLDSSRKRVDFDSLLDGGGRYRRGEVPADRDGLRGLVRRVGDAGEPVLAVIESMMGARFVHDELELAGWDVRIADAYKAKGLAPLACKTDRLDCWVLAELARRDLVPEIWLPDPAVRAERERARIRLHLVKHRRRDRRHRPFRHPPQAGRLHRAHPQGGAVRRARPARAAEEERAPHLRWALIEAAHTAGRDPRYRPIVERMRARHGKKRGSKIAAIEIGRRLSEAIWHMLTNNQPFAPAGAPTPLAA